MLNSTPAHEYNNAAANMDTLMVLPKRLIQFTKTG
jgi:hypothetical protein